MGRTYGIGITLFDRISTATGVLFFASMSAIVAYRLHKSQDAAKKAFTINLKGGASYLLNFFRKLGKRAIKFQRLIYNSHTLFLSVVVVCFVTLLFSFLITSLFSIENLEPANDDLGDDISSDDYGDDFSGDDFDRNVPAFGSIMVEGLEIYGGDIKYNPANYSFYVDWGELTIGSSKNVSFYVKSNSNVDVILAMNVTNWQPYRIDNYIDISWNYDGSILSPSSELLVTLTLEVASSGAFIDYVVENSFTSFSFDITVYALGV